MRIGFVQNLTNIKTMSKFKTYIMITTKELHFQFKYTDVTVPKELAHLPPKLKDFINHFMLHSQQSLIALSSQLRMIMESI